MTKVDDKRVKDAIDGVRFAEVIAKQIIAEATRKLRCALLDSDINVKDQAAILGVTTQRVYQMRKGTRT
jgi:signal recognition particle GTPase